MAHIPLTAIIVTKNEEAQIATCLDALQDIEQILVVDSNSQDRTCEIANTYNNVQCVNFTWNGRYPKKRQWCLDNAQGLDIKHEWVLFIDADEHMSAALTDEIRTLFAAPQALQSCAGFFLRGRYVMNGKTLKYGLHNNKLALINRHQIIFPAVDDLDIEGMGEIEGHYQPVRTPAHKTQKIGQLQSPLTHDALHTIEDWRARHKRYAKWEAAMDARGAWPQESQPVRRLLKNAFKALPCRGLIAFIHSYIVKLGFLDGAAGYQFALLRKSYYDDITRLRRANRNIN